MIIHTVLFLIFMGLLIREDMARFEIEFTALAMVALNGAALNIHLGQSPLEMALGSLIWAVAALAVRMFKSRNALGLGDVYLFAVIGLMSGLDAAPVAVLLFVLFSLITSWSYARARHRPMARSLYPAALPGGLTILVILMGQLLWMQIAVGAVSTSSNSIIGDLTLAYGPWIAVVLAPCAAVLMVMDRQNRERSAQHG